MCLHRGNLFRLVNFLRQAVALAGEIGLLEKISPDMLSGYPGVLHYFA